MRYAKLQFKLWQMFFVLLFIVGLVISANASFELQIMNIWIGFLAMFFAEFALVQMSNQNQ